MKPPDEYFYLYATVDIRNVPMIKRFSKLEICRYSLSTIKAMIGLSITPFRQTILMQDVSYWIIFNR